MTFSSLMRKSPSATPKPRLTADEFIDQASYYAAGQAHPKLKVVESPGPVSPCAGEPMKTTSVRLTDDARETLDALSQKTGISRSRLVRIWLGQLDPEVEAQSFLASVIR
ncbi:hypothetical protein HMF8227_00491 [Saliniradius amylolyticus]|uniref:Ribbon-helix-helix protein CopG domain-containing protein n=1 Tax=Saliniradius amylolyticus TaxID=2183582 RepID=A0A2S2E1T4_9ALTE|nr:CopG family transcriptional regulator [Saliniradius amylolyticus]AWL10987.1 hypothetical protein HMF8227_00491 [Saliniradius amylolyticus]